MTEIRMPVEDLYDDIERQDKEIENLRKANEQLRIKNQSLTTAIKLDEKANDWRQHRISELEKISIVNNNSDMMSAGDLTKLEDVPKQIRISDYIYAFVQNENASGRFVCNWVRKSSIPNVAVL